jgi:hypothetical protein
MVTAVCGRPAAGHDCENCAGGKIARRLLGSERPAFLLPHSDDAHSLTGPAGETMYKAGGLAFGREHLRPASAVRLARLKITAELREIPGRTNHDPAAAGKETVAAVEKHRRPLEDATFEESPAIGAKG